MDHGRHGQFPQSLLLISQLAIPQGPYSIQFQGSDSDGNSLFCVQMDFNIVPGGMHQLPPSSAADAIELAKVRDLTLNCCCNRRTLCSNCTGGMNCADQLLFLRIRLLSRT